MAEGVPLKLRYRIIDPDTDAEIVKDLFHLGGSWTVRALRPGYPGSVSLGEFRILLPPRRSDEHATYRKQIDAILGAANAGIGLKVEAYMGSAGGATPVLSGVITGMDLPYDEPWALTGVDTLVWLQRAQLVPGEEGSLLSNAYAGYSVATAFFGTMEALWDDDFTNWNSGANYTASGFTAATDPLFGEAAIKATSAATGSAVSSTSWSDNQFGANYLLLSAAQVTAWGVAVADATAGAGTGPAPGLWILSDSTGANAVLVDFLMKQTGAASGAWNIDARVGTWVAGVYTQQTLVSNVFTNVPAVFPFELGCSIYSSFIPGPAVRVAFKLFLNGKECATYYDTGGFVIPATGKVGVRFGSLGGSTEGYFSRLQFQGRAGSWWGTPRFALGASYTGTNVAASSGSQGTNHLDWILAAAAHDGAELRKIAGRGKKADVLDYGLALGADLSDKITFGEGGSVVKAVSANVAEVYATESRINSVPFGDSGGRVTWGRLHAAGDMVQTETVADVGLVGYEFLTRYGRAIAERKASPLVARQVTVERTAAMTQNGGFGPRELDSVRVHLPAYGIFQHKARIVGLTVTEGSPLVTYELDEFSPAARMPAERILRSLDYLTTTYARR